MIISLFATHIFKIGSRWLSLIISQQPKRKWKIKKVIKSFFRNFDVEFKNFAQDFFYDPKANSQSIFLQLFKESFLYTYIKILLAAAAVGKNVNRESVIRKKNELFYSILSNPGHPRTAHTRLPDNALVDKAHIIRITYIHMY